MQQVTIQRIRKFLQSPDKLSAIFLVDLFPYRGPEYTVTVADESGTIVAVADILGGAARIFKLASNRNHQPLALGDVSLDTNVHFVYPLCDELHIQVGKLEEINVRYDRQLAREMIVCGLEKLVEEVHEIEICRSRTKRLLSDSGGIS